MSIGLIQVSDENSQVPSGGHGRNGKKWLDSRSIIRVEQVLLWDLWWAVREREESGLF